ALSEETKRLRDQEQARLTKDAYAEALRLVAKHRALLDRVALALLARETLSREELLELFGDVEPESRSSETVGIPRVVAAGPSPERWAEAMTADLREDDEGRRRGSVRVTV